MMSRFVQSRIPPLAMMLVFMVLDTPGLAATRNVPAQYPTIQGAIDAAAHGDQVVVAPGTYNERINFFGRQITIRSSAGAAVTTIDGQNVDRTVRTDNATHNSVLDGFTITGGGLHTAFSQPTIKNCIFSNNTKDDGAAVRMDNSSAVFVNCEFNNNTAQFDNGGAIIAYGNTGRPYFQNCTFRNNMGNATGGGNGGAVRLYNSNMVVTFDTCMFLANEALNGGAVFIEDRNVSAFLDCTFADNIAHYGAAVGTWNQCAPAFERCTFSNNAATDEGGAADLNGGGGTFTFCTFLTNAANVGGGINREDQTSLLIEDCQFIGNIGRSNEGGAMNLRGQGTVTIRRSVYTDNSAPGSGGGIHSRDGVHTTIEDCTFQNHRGADAGGALYVCCNAVLAVSRSQFTGNVSNRGGAIFVDGGNAQFTIDQSAFQENGANDGGAVKVQFTTAPIIRNCRFQANSAGSGGAVRVEQVTDLLIEGCLMFDNYANDWGGAIDVCGATGNSRITSSTVAHNVGNNAAGLGTNCGSSVAVTNCIVWGNTDRGGTPNQLINESGPSSTISYCNVEGGFSGIGNIDADPRFHDPAAGDYRLKTGSPCIDAGLNSAVPVDLILDLGGQPRVQDGDADAIARVDMGSYESSDCNGNAVPDYSDIIAGTSTDLDLNGVPDECDSTFAYNLTLATLYPSIAQALAAAANGHEIVATSLAFAAASSIDFNGKGIDLYSAAGILQPSGGLIELADNSRLI